MDFKRPDQKQQKFWEQTSLLYQSQMTQECLSYLHGRGLRDETIRYFHLGQVVDPVKEHEMFGGRLCIPYLKKHDRVVALKFRCLRHEICEGHAKYLTEGEQWLFNTNDLENADDQICLTEGEIDAMILHQIGLPAVGIPGVKAWKGHPHWPDTLREFDRYLMFADNDTSKKQNWGMELATKVKADLPRTLIVNLPEDQDVNSTYLSYGPGELYERAGVPWIDSEEFSETSTEQPSLELLSA